MRIVLQRVKEASVTVSNKKIASIKEGFLILLGIEDSDTQEDIEWLSRKIVNMRVFSDENEHMNNAIKAVDGAILVVSQFTLHASTKKGNRPSFIKAARPEVAIPLYESFIKQLEVELGKKIEAGSFGAMMDVALVNDGPVTIIMDSKNKE
ncbi:D-aminoacyl-tRNA deacylase [Patiriisocius hiemis]|uniref:D-aminoacyl-tRNA deacylase n=1 Tax=Patiriisocius hiemis TaxID=3075604 RepID=A0ABU2YC74_9FLAO|nr:D-aminoacyl-tRNA deacylase [Constantimarinum sp. W242]MDT0555788.1 D-aminoacyl-tRNA deacylase [Constantimarinum sp. W242]